MELHEKDIMFKSRLILVTMFFLLIVIKVKSQDWNLLRIDKFVDDVCDVQQNGVTVKGFCTPIVKCPAILTNLRKGQYNHTVCGYEGTTQIVCCPTSTPNVNARNVTKLNLNKSCQIILNTGGQFVFPENENENFF